MAETQQSKKSTTTSQAVVDLVFPEVPLGEGPRKHKPRLYDPRIVDDYFRPLLKNIPSAEERWKKKENSTPFLGL